MLDKGHCHLADDAIESEELGEFWESESGSEEDDDVKGQERTIADSRIDEETKELQLSSGRRLGHRSNARHSKHNHNPSNSKPSDIKAIEDKTHPNTNGNGKSPEAGSSTSLGLSLKTPANRADRRAAMALTHSDHANKGLIGLSELEKRAIRATEKKIAKMEVRARNLYAARVERGGNKQKYFKVSESFI